MRRARATLVAAAALLVPLTGRTEDPPRSAVDFRWSAPAGCPTEAGVRAEIERLLGRPLDGAFREGLRAHAEVFVHGDRYRVRVRISTSHGTRERAIEARTCAEATDAAALVTAMAIDPESVERAKRGGDAAVADTPGTAPASPRRASNGPAGKQPSPRPRQRHTDDADGNVAAREADASGRVRIPVRVVAGLDASALPAPSPGVGVSGGALFGSFRAEAFFAAWSKQRGRVAGRDAGADVSLILGGARACFAPRIGTVEVGACGGLEVGSMAATGYGVSVPENGRGLWLAPSAGALAAWSFSSRFAAVASLEAAVPLERHRFVLTGIGEVHRYPALTGRALGGIEVRLR